MTPRRFAVLAPVITERLGLTNLEFAALGQRHVRQYQHVYMVGHDDPNLQLIELLLALATRNRFHYLPRDSRIAQPETPMALS